MLAPRHLILTALEGALIDPRTNSFAGAEDALSEIERRRIPYILLSSRTREEIESIRRKLGHNHPFVTEDGGAIFFPDGYLSVRIPDVVRTARYLSVAFGMPYDEVCEALDEIAEESGVGVVGFHQMSAREIAENTGLSARDAELARAREFDEPFFFTTDDAKAIERFTNAARERGFDVRRGAKFWHISSGCDAARAVRLLGQLFREATRNKLRLVGIGASEADLPWLRAVDQAVLLPPTAASRTEDQHPSRSQKQSGRGASIAVAQTPGPAGWSEAILNIIG